jgi:hypothetical protein
LNFVVAVKLSDRESDVCCAGAAMFLFSSKTGSSMLYTGDMRYSERIRGGLLAAMKELQITELSSMRV